MSSFMFSFDLMCVCEVLCRYSIWVFFGGDLLLVVVFDHEIEQRYASADLRGAAQAKQMDSCGFNSKNCEERLINSSEHDQEDEDFWPEHENFKNRQLYLHSYTFTREKTFSEKLKSSLNKFKAAAWAVMACNYKPLRARKMNQMLTSKSSCVRSGDSLVLPLRKRMRVSG